MHGKLQGIPALLAVLRCCNATCLWHSMTQILPWTHFFKKLLMGCLLDSQSEIKLSVIWELHRLISPTVPIAWLEVSAGDVAVCSLVPYLPVTSPVTKARMYLLAAAPTQHTGWGVQSFCRFGNGFHFPWPELLSTLLQRGFCTSFALCKVV